MTRCVMVWLYQWVNGQPLYLLLKRNHILGGYWQPVTGYIEESETDRYAALRELLEETGIEDYARILDPEYSFVFDMNGASCTVTVFAVEVKDPPEIIISYEHTESMWLFYEDARKQLYWPNNVETIDFLHKQLLNSQIG